MPKLTPYFQLLVQLRADLAENLVKMGVMADDTEPIQTLVPKVLQIMQGDTSQEVFIADIQSDFDVSYGYFSTGEAANFSGMCIISALCRVSSLTVNVIGAGVGDHLGVNAPGWTISRETNSITLTRLISYRFEAQIALDVISFYGTGIDITASVSVLAALESGATMDARGRANLKYRYGANWGLIEATGYTWADIEDKEMTWEGMENMGKPVAHCPELSEHRRDL